MEREQKSGNLALKTLLLFEKARMYCRLPTGSLGLYLNSNINNELQLNHREGWISSICLKLDNILAILYHYLPSHISLNSFINKGLVFLKSNSENKKP